MTTSEISILNGLNMAQSSLVSVDQLSDEALTQLIALSLVLGQWLQAASGEAVDRARDGVCFDGYTLKESTRRRITAPDGALEAVRQIDPSLVPLCQNTELAGIKELQKRLGRKRFEEIFGPYITQSSSFRLIPEGE